MSNWISVEERLPEDYDNVLVVFEWGNIRWIDVACRMIECWWRKGRPCQCSVTHWMPLPEPPKEEA